MIELNVRRTIGRVVAGFIGALVGLLALAPRELPAQLQVDITSGVTAPIPIAIEDFTADPNTTAQVIRQNLARSGRFLIGARTAADYLVIGRVTVGAEGRLTLDFELTNLLTGQRLLASASPRRPEPGAMRRTVSAIASMKRFSVRAALSPPG